MSKDLSSQLAKDFNEIKETVSSFSPESLQEDIKSATHRQLRTNFVREMEPQAYIINAYRRFISAVESHNYVKAKLEVGKIFHYDLLFIEDILSDDQVHFLINTIKSTKNFTHGIVIDLNQGALIIDYIDRIIDSMKKADYSTAKKYIRKIYGFSNTIIRKNVSQEDLIQLIKYELEISLHDSTTDWFREILPKLKLNLGEIKYANPVAFWDTARWILEASFQIKNYAQTIDRVNMFFQEGNIPDDYTQEYLFVLKIESLYHLKKYTEAQKTISSMMSYLINDALDKPELLSDVYMWQGLCYLAQGKKQEAFDALEIAMDYNPNNETAKEKLLDVDFSKENSLIQEYSNMKPRA